MSEKIFLIDYENQSQNFCNFSSFSYRSVKIILFVGKSTKIDEKFESNSKSNDNITVIRSKTDGPEAADTSLIFHCSNILNSYQTYCKYFLVCGTEKGYEELSFRMKEKLNDKFEKIDGINKKITDFIDNTKVCGACKKVDDNYYSHPCGENMKCSGCKMDYRRNCSVSINAHRITSYVKCKENFQCNFNFYYCTMESPEIKNHFAKAHPTCNIEGCSCKKQFSTVSQYQTHETQYRDQLEFIRSSEKCKYCDDRIRFYGNGGSQMILHLREHHLDKLKLCPCGLGFQDEIKLKKHTKKKCSK